MPHNDAYRQLWHVIVPWVGENLLHLHGDMTEVANGSGDQLYDYILLLCLFVVAIMATAIWSWVDRKRTNYDQLYQWLRVFVRLTLAVAMMGYGANKLFRMQFPAPPLYRFVDYYGNSSPVGLLWTFMGMSRAYSLFAGIAEMVGGLLLIVPRFTTLGALVVFGVMSNVLMLNFCYDVPRKIYSVHLVLMSLFLLLPDIKRLLNFFLLNLPTEPAPTVPLLKDPRSNRWGLWLQYGIGVAAIGLSLNHAHNDAIKSNAYLPPPIRGIWSVDEFVLDGTPQAPVLGGSDRWQRVVLDTPGTFYFQGMDNAIGMLTLQLDPSSKTMNLTVSSEPSWRSAFTYELPDPDHLVLDGNLNGRPLKISLHRMDLTQFLLLNRGFHMVNQSMLKR
jgi:uncharacterized membrane protein YphA (DoxX/SURF4 family)